MVPTKYARVDDVDVAYQTVGSGPRDIVFLGDWYTHVEAQWEDPLSESFLKGLARAGRLILFDKRGTGLSDPVPLSGLPAAEAWADDLVGVLDAVDSTSTVIVAASGGAALALPFTASHPDRVSALALIDSTACVRRSEDYPCGVPQHLVEWAGRWLPEVWGTGESVDLITRSRRTDPAFREWRARYERLAASPGTVRRMQEVVFGIDVRAVLPSIHVPSLVIHRQRDPWVRVEHGRYLAAHIEGARFVELPGEDHLWFGLDTDDLVAEVVEFVTGVRPSAASSRILTTVMFTDIVSSTTRAADLGDATWHSVLDRHDRIVHRQLERYDGRRVKQTGDGVLAAFDAPARAVRCGTAVVEALRAIGLEARVGIHTGECEVRGEDLSGLAVHIAARIASLAAPGQIVVSGTVRDLMVGSALTFDDLGAYELRGVPGTWTLLTASES